MALALVSTATGSGTSSATVSKPTGKWTDGNILLAIVSYAQVIGNNPGTINTPSGWTITSGTATSGESVVFRRVCSSEPASYNFSVTPDSGDTVETCSISVVEYSGQDATTPINAVATQKNGNSKTASFNSVTSTVNNCLILAWVGAVFNATNGTFAVPTGFTAEVGPTKGTTGSDGFVAYTQEWDKAQTTAGAITPGNSAITSSATAANTFWDTHVIALAPATGGPTPKPRSFVMIL